MTSMAKAIGTVRATDTNVKGHVLRASSGSGMTFTKARGLGKCMVKDLDGVIARAKLQYLSLIHISEPTRRYAISEGGRGG